MSGRSSRAKIYPTDNAFTMKILMLAPEPFFQPRGTPISVHFRLKALSGMGHEVDLITYPLGEDRAFPGLRILRVPRWPGLRRIRIGPSPAKLPLDAMLMLRAMERLATRRYDLVFSHEEAAFFGTPLARMRGLPHVYDMHSSLPQQLENFRFTRSRLLKKIFERLEGAVLRRSASVIVICPDLLETVTRLGWSKKTVLLENVLDFEGPPLTEAAIREARRKIARGDEKILLYAGNFQPYQGVERLLEAVARIEDPRVRLLLVGDTPDAVADMRDRAAAEGIAEHVHFTGQVPPDQVPLYIAASDALVSPRISGTNTPLKIYSFLKSGKPLVATRLRTHTQVLDDRIAFLVDTDAESMAEGIKSALFSPESADRARAAKEKADREYTFENYRDKLAQVLNMAAAHKKNRGRVL